MEMMLEVAICVMDMEDDKVADMVFMIPNENFADVIVAIGDTNGDDVRGNDGGAGHGSWQEEKRLQITVLYFHSAVGMI